MAKYILLAFLFPLAMLLSADCARKSQPEDPKVWNKVKVDFARLDENGLAGPPAGKVAVNYEFCIPGAEKNWGEVQKIDKTAKLHKQSKGRSNCDKDSWLVIGSTHQQHYRRVLYELAALPYVQQIQETYFE